MQLIINTNLSPRTALVAGVSNSLPARAPDLVLGDVFPVTIILTDGSAVTAASGLATTAVKVGVGVAGAATPYAYEDTFAAGGTGTSWTGTLDLATSELNVALGSETYLELSLEVELTDVSSNRTTVLQIPVVVRNQVIDGTSFPGADLPEAVLAPGALVEDGILYADANGQAVTNATGFSYDSATNKVYGTTALVLSNDVSTSYARITLNRTSNTGLIAFEHDVTTQAVGYRFTGLSSLSSSVYNLMSLGATMTQSGTAGYNLLRMAVIETTAGSGLKYFFNCTHGAGNDHRWTVDSTGKADAAAGIRLRSQAALGSPADGDVWTDSTRKGLQCFTAGIRQGLSGCIYTQTATALVEESVAETTMFGSGLGTLTLPANFATVGTVLRATLFGTWRHGVSTPQTLALKVKLGATTIVQNANPEIASEVTARAFRLTADVVFRTIGATANCYGSLNMERGLSDPFYGANTTAVEVDTTGSLAFDVTAQFSESSENNGIIITGATVEVIRPGA